MNGNPQMYLPQNKNTTSLLKLFIIGCIILALMIPVAWISSLIHERYKRRDSVVNEIATKWGANQIVSGPFISVPYYIKILHQGNDGKESNYIQTRYLHLTPENMDIIGKVKSTIQHRGIYKVPGYLAELDIEAAFAPDKDKAGLSESINLDWENALVMFDLADERGLKELIGTFNDKSLKFNKSQDVLKVAGNPEPDKKPRKILSSFDSYQEPAKDTNFKFEAKTQTMNPANNKIKLHLTLTGTQKLSFLTSAIKENIKLSGDWKSPSFTGDILPDTRTVNNKGFIAEWHTNYLNTGNKPAWTSEDTNLRLSVLGVSFLVPVDAYQQTTRTLKYSILFLLLTFMTFFFAETVTRQRIHPIQYLMVGCSLVIFYLLLLSLSEHISFGWSYLIASAGVILQISLYCYTILRTRKFALQTGGILTALYVFLYILLQLEDSALLVGSISLFVLLGIAMYVIRNVKWYNQE